MRRAETRVPHLAAALTAIATATLLIILTTGTVLAAGLVPEGVCGPAETTFDDDLGAHPVDPGDELAQYDGCTGTDAVTGDPITVWAWTGIGITGQEMIETLLAGEFAVLGLDVERMELAGQDVVAVQIISGPSRSYYWYAGNTLFAADATSVEAAERAIGLVGSGGGATVVSSVPSPDQISLDPVVIATSATIAAGIAISVPFPGSLFNSTLDANYGEVSGWFRRFRRSSSRAGSGLTSRIGAFFATPRGVAAFIGLAAVIYGFLDPAFGLNPESALTVVGIAAGLALLSLAGQLPSRIFAARRLGEPGRIRVRAAGLLVAAGCVLISRITDFQPGYLYGLMVGYAFTRTLTERQEGAEAAIGSASSLVLALVAFVGLGLVRAPFGGPAPIWLLPLEVGLAIVVIGGIEDVIFGLMPLRYLPGESVMRWSRLGWAVLFGIAAFAFLHVLVNPSSGYLADTTIQPLVKVVALGFGFGLVSVLFWAYFRFRRAPPAEPSAPAPAN
jgi:hypothetical protein